MRRALRRLDVLAGRLLNPLADAITRTLDGWTARVRARRLHLAELRGGTYELRDAAGELLASSDHLDEMVAMAEDLGRAGVVTTVMPRVSDG